MDSTENYDLYQDLDLDRSLTGGELAKQLDGRIRYLLADGLAPTAPEIDQMVTARAILSDEVKRDTYDAALDAGGGAVTVTWLHLLADAQERPRRAQGSPAQLPPAPLNARGRSPHPRFRSLEVFLLFVGGAVALVVSAAVDPTEADAVGRYVRTGLALVGYLICVRSAAALVRAVVAWNRR